MAFAMFHIAAFHKFVDPNRYEQWLGDLLDTEPLEP
jgi:hypothetical protein